MSKETLIWIYGVGYQCFEGHQKEAAFGFFQMLTLLNPLVSDYWVALGVTQRSLSEESDALYSFEMASLMDSNNPIPIYNSIEIHLKLNQIEEAKKELQLLKEVIKTHRRDDLQPAFEFIQGQVQLAKAS